MGLGECHVFRDLSSLTSPLQTSILQQTQLWWTVRITSIERVRLSLNAGFVGRPDLGKPQNLVLYLRKGAAPTQKLYDYRMTGNQAVTINSIFPNDSACGEWVIMLENIGNSTEPFVLSWTTDWSCPLLVQADEGCEGSSRTFAIDYPYAGQTQYSSNCSSTFSGDQWMVHDACNQYCQLEVRVNSTGCSTGICRQTVKASDCVTCEIQIDHDPLREGVFIASTPSAFNHISWNTTCAANLSQTSSGMLTLALSGFQTCTVSLLLDTSCNKVNCSQTIAYTSPSVEKNSSLRFPLHY
eukprot:TRINITY_DN2093_c0_g1_i1.p1 TRINITY_DN2093_c0_g1~~TRINITY_DN2093_c0_g1_i1.p1  ORF type:complete len:297 (+),score=54.99 TRINITY_DN2093_c0_g1_i1:573-1463(+)